MRIVIIGTGYVGLVSGACFAEIGHEVICIDNDKSKIDNLKRNIIPIYEPGLEQLIIKNAASNRIKFSQNLTEAVLNAEVIFLAVGTPTKVGCNSVDMSYINNAAKQISEVIKTPLPLVIKSTVPVGTNKQLTEIFKKSGCDVISNPEFLREGFAINDFMYPDRIVIGIRTDNAMCVMNLVYDHYLKSNIPILYCAPESAELIKYAANAFLATKITFINEMADIAEKTDANIQDIAKALGLDSRIGNKFLEAGPGFGGSCFPKDILAISHLANEYMVPSQIVDAVIKANNDRKIRLATQVIDIMGSVQGKIIACLGLAFKANTDDIRESPAIEIIKILAENGAIINCYDPAAMDNAKKQLDININYFLSADLAMNNAEAIIILTEWPEFAELNYDNLENVKVIDYRNLLKNKNHKIKNYYKIG
jgi:UDPglucose 6-dehydrogenase